MSCWKTIAWGLWASILLMLFKGLGKVVLAGTIAGGAEVDVRSEQGKRLLLALKPGLEIGARGDLHTNKYCKSRTNCKFFKLRG
jgi:hypothetical protein